MNRSIHRTVSVLAGSAAVAVVSVFLTTGAAATDPPEDTGVAETPVEIMRKGGDYDPPPIDPNDPPTPGDGGGDGGGDDGGGGGGVFNGEGNDENGGNQAPVYPIVHVDDLSYITGAYLAMLGGDDPILYGHCDLDRSGDFTIEDVELVNDFLTGGAAVPTTPFDMNDDGVVDISDVVVAYAMRAADWKAIDFNLNASADDDDIDLILAAAGF
ncbi:MAG: hypothetical protein AB8G96_13290 [Phycisphaerales bacterium]